MHPLGINLAIIAIKQSYGCGGKALANHHFELCLLQVPLKAHGDVAEQAWGWRRANDLCAETNTSLTSCPRTEIVPIRVQEAEIGYGDKAAS